MNFDPLLLETRGVFFGEHFVKILALSFLGEFEGSSLCAQSFRTLPLKTGVDICVPSWVRNVELSVTLVVVALY